MSSARAPRGLAWESTLRRRITQGTPDPITLWFHVENKDKDGNQVYGVSTSQ